MKKLLILGGTHYQIPVIDYARSQGHYVITCDYLPSNPGHQRGNEYQNISTTDRHAILNLAKTRSIDGILAYASDPAAPTAAYVANELGLPGNPFQAVETLTNKSIFRDFLSSHGFACPKHISCTNLQQAKVLQEQLKFPLVLKPVDSSGSKGVCKVNNWNEIEAAFELTMLYSKCKRVILEEWIDRSGYQIAGDGFVVEGKLAFYCFAQEHFDRTSSGFVPIGESFPLLITEANRSEIINEIQRLLNLLGMKSGALNFDIAIGEDKKIYLIEIGPRSGGNMIPEAIRLACDVDLAKYSVDMALGLDCSSLRMTNCQRNIATIVVHSDRAGIFHSLEISEKLNVIWQQMFVKPGDRIERFTGSHCTLGILIASFSSSKQMLDALDNFRDYYQVVVSE